MTRNLTARFFFDSIFVFSENKFGHLSKFINNFSNLQFKSQKMSALCRLCLSEGEKLTEVSELRERLPISVIIMIICPIKIESDDSLPKEICEECLLTVLSAYKLRDVSNNTDRYLRSCNEDIVIKSDLDESLEIENADLDENNKIADKSLAEDDEDEEEDELMSKGNYIVYESGDITINDEILAVVDEEDDESVKKENEYTNLELVKAASTASKRSDMKYMVDCSNIEAKKSPVWNFFGQLHDDGYPVAAEKDFYFCRICVEELNTLKPKYKAESTATSVLFSHLARVHGINREEMTEITNGNSSHPTPELIACEICLRSFNAGSMEIHMAIEHDNRVKSRKSGPSSPLYKVNCFKNSSKSMAWDYFGALENLKGEQIDAYYFYCRLCVEEENKLSPKYTKNTSTSILLQHLKNAHTPKDENAKRKMPEPIYTDSKRSKLDCFTCELCGEQLESRKSFNRHLLIEHNEDQPRDFHCDYKNCNKAFTQRDTLLKHIKNIHEGSKFPCDRCPAELATRMSLRRHIDTCHLKLKSFTCDACNATYTEQKTLKNHIQKVHLGVDNKKVPCELCELKFPNQWSLRRHLMTHTGEVSRSLGNFQQKLLTYIF